MGAFILLMGIFICIGIFVSPAGALCALLEKKITGKVQMENPFKKRRRTSLLISQIISTVIAFLINANLHKAYSYQALNWTILILSIIIGIILFYLIHLGNYSIFLKNAPRQSTWTMDRQE